MRIAVWVLVVILAGAVVLPAAEPPKTGPETENRFPPLVVPTGFKATLFACDPLIEYPSVISAGPRPGAIFVAVDFMAGFAPDVDKKSEVRLVQDTDGDGYADVAPVFAAGFNSIQGIAWHAGSVYVMHAPFLTRVRDADGDGKAEERTDLFGGLGILPEDNPGRLHCANGVTAGHDGWLYLALGDHGCEVERPEGDKLVFHGGGILRCRADGRDLHVFSTGLRNIYDVALDAELNVFVRDNENDGGDYKIRICHSFFGADHGYPYKYYERPDEALPPLADLGLGSSAGGVAYLETQFPPEYRGNLFFCEWGRSIVRYAPQHNDSGFAPVTESEFAAGAPGDPYGFKPTDAVVESDGTLVVSDWCDGQRPRRGRGRIYAIRYTCKDTGPVRPVSEKLAVNPNDSGVLLARLDSESYAERCEAQATLERRNDLGLGLDLLLLPALAEKKLGPRGRKHAVWIIQRRASNPAKYAEIVDKLLNMARSDPDASVRVQAIRAIADLADPVLVRHRLDVGFGDAALAERLAELGEEGADRRVQLAVIVALGRLKWKDFPAWLAKNLKKPDPPLAHAASWALRQYEHWPPVLKLLDLPSNDPLRKIALHCIAEQYDSEVADGLIQLLTNARDAARRLEYADQLSRIYKKPAPWVYWNYRPAPRPANTVDWESTVAIAEALSAALADPIDIDGLFDPKNSVRLAVLRRMQREKIPVRSSALLNWLATERDADCVAALLESLADEPADEIRPQVEAIVNGRKHSLANRQAALAIYLRASDIPLTVKLELLAQSLEDGPLLADVLRRLGKYPELATRPLFVRKLTSPEPVVRAAAIEALGELKADEGRGKLVGLLADADPQVRRAAAVAAGKLEAKDAAEALLKVTADSDPAARRASFASLTTLREPRGIPLAVAALKDRQVDLAAIEFLRQVGNPSQRNEVKEWAIQNPSLDVLLAAIRTLSEWRGRKNLYPLEIRLLDGAVAEIHGSSGNLIRWQAVGPMKPNLVESVQSGLQVGAINDVPILGVLFAAGTESRVVIPTKNVSEPVAWLAYADATVPEMTEVEILTSGSGNLGIYLNGRSLLQRQEPRDFRVDSERLQAVLARGTNRLVVQVSSDAQLKKPSAAPTPVEFHLRFRRKSATAELEKLAQAVLARPGNANRGRELFQNVEKSLCLKCHRLGEQGERIGPELTGVGSRFSRIYLAESILEPSRTIAPSFGTLVVLLADGTTKSGVKVAETETSLTLVDNQGAKHEILKADIDQQRASPLSTMPDGLAKRLSEEEFVDLVAFLAGQKETRAP